MAVEMKRDCPYKNDEKRIIIHLEDDPGYETENRHYEDPDDEGFLYDNLD